VLLKSYFRHPDDPRDRLGTEFAFARFAWDHGVNCIPQPLAADPAAGLGLFEFVEGWKLKPEEVTAERVSEALSFFVQLNANKDAAADLPVGSESCFSLEDHFRTIARRVERLKAIEPKSELDRDAVEFVTAEFFPLAAMTFITARNKAIELGLDIETPLPAAERCVSPSDFGYHNALLASDKKLRFLDFEYAGWDDPSKLVGDFFCQPAIPAPHSEFDRFVETVANAMPTPELHGARARLLFPLYRVKWVCILLNDFQPVGGSRRAFAGVGTEQEARKAAQLEKARAAVRQLG
jgi:cob(I)alamin adenosyltransferase